jgi:NAD(P)-dependent dehydrogenase (short-subunit alcohol dehydrogenase family)
MAREAAVVVGVGPGLGWSIVKRFSSAGMHVIAAARNPDRLASLVNPADRLDVEFQPCDATQPQDVDRLFAAVRAAFGSPRFVSFNAGTFQPGEILQIAPDSFENSWRVGCFGGFLVGQAAARAMVEEGRGTIIFTGATASMRGSANFANLAVPKFGLRALAQSMARELGPKGVHVAHAVIDGQIESDRYRHLAVERGPDSLLPPDAIAEMYYQLHKQPRGAWSHELDFRPWSEKF